MDFAEGTEFFVDLEGAFFEAEEGVLSERFALLANFLPFRSVLAVAIRPYHHGNELFLPLPRFQLSRHFPAFPVYHTRLFPICSQKRTNGQ